VRTIVKGRGRTVDATIVGVAREIDLALLKVDDDALPALPLADYDAVRQGELVFAFGSPEGLKNSVTMGVVSGVARQADPDSPLVYVQTDAPINHGNSGGPLSTSTANWSGSTRSSCRRRAAARVSDSPSRVRWSRWRTRKLRRFGHLHRGELGILLQTITPTLASGLGLSQDWGAMISDVSPDSPAAQAGSACRTSSSASTAGRSMACRDWRFNSSREARAMWCGSRCCAAASGIPRT
jgi:serine protease Do